MRTERALLDWILVNSHSCTFRLDGSVSTNDSRLERRYLFNVSVSAPTDCSFPAIKEEICRQLTSFLGSGHSTNVVVVAADCNA